MALRKPPYLQFFYIKHIMVSFISMQGGASRPALLPSRKENRRSYKSALTAPQRSAYVSEHVPMCSCFYVPMCCTVPNHDLTPTPRTRAEKQQIQNYEGSRVKHSGSKSEVLSLCHVPAGPGPESRSSTRPHRDHRCRLQETRPPARTARNAPRSAKKVRNPAPQL